MTSVLLLWVACWSTPPYPQYHCIGPLPEGEAVRYVEYWQDNSPEFKVWTQPYTGFLEGSEWEPKGS